MVHRVRSATLADVERLCEIRAARALRSAAGSGGLPPRGGFLLGASAETYRSYVAMGWVRVATGREDRATAFSVVLPDEALRRSSFYERRR